MNYKELKGKCSTCLGCNLLENEDFSGYYRCENYVKGAEDKEDGSRRFIKIYA